MLRGLVTCNGVVGRGEPPQFRVLTLLCISCSSLGDLLNLSVRQCPYIRTVGTVVMQP